MTTILLMSTHNISKLRSFLHWVRELSLPALVFTGILIFGHFYFTLPNSSSRIGYVGIVAGAFFAFLFFRFAELVSEWRKTAKDNNQQLVSLQVYCNEIARMNSHNREVLKKFRGFIRTFENMSDQDLKALPMRFGQRCQLLDLDKSFPEQAPFTDLSNCTYTLILSLSRLNESMKMFNLFMEDHSQLIQEDQMSRRDSVTFLRTIGSQLSSLESYLTDADEKALICGAFAVAQLKTNPAAVYRKKISLALWELDRDDPLVLQEIERMREAREKALRESFNHIRGNGPQERKGNVE